MGIRNLYLFFILFSLTGISQVKLDSIFHIVDTIPSFQKKLYKLESVSAKNRLTKKELNLLLGKISSCSNGSADKTNLYAIQNSIGNVYFFQNKANDALTEYFKLLKSAEAGSNKFYIGQAHNQIAETYLLLQNKVFAEKHLYFAMQFFEKTDSIKYIADVYNLLGTNFKNTGKFDSALFYHERALALRKKANTKRGIAYSLNNIGLVHLKMNNLVQAEDYLKKSLEIKRTINDKKGTAGSLINLGDVYLKLKKYKDSKAYYEEGTQLAREAKAGNFYKIGVSNLALLFFEMGDFKNSAIFYRKSRSITDSLREEETNKQIAELTSQYETEKKDSEIALQQEQLKSQQSENSKQKIMIIASGVALLMMVVAIFFIYRSYRQNKRNALELAAKNHVIEEKNREITDSINYAKLIQQSLLASKEMLDKNLESYFVLYKPKDIVSGDFYWASESDNGFLIACVDCTGHGVPGAFMSLIGKENLDKAASKTINPGEILQELNINVKRSLNQTASSGSRDGMDAAILRVEKDEAGNANLYYAGANRPLYILRQNTHSVEEVKATKQAIGGFTNSDQKFDEHTLHINKGDTIIITTDGYADQFGSTNNKKLTTKRFKDLLVSIQSKNSQEQKQTLEEFFTKWKGNFEQLDDLLIIGINI